MEKKSLSRKYCELIEMCIDFYNSDEVPESIKVKCLEMAADVTFYLSTRLEIFLLREKNQKKREIRGACGQEEYCCCYNQAKGYCRNADCEHFIPLNDFSEEAHKSEMELQKEKTEQA